MQIARSAIQVAIGSKGCVLTIGNFDGVHLGHRELIRQTLAEAKRLGVPSMVVTFDPHPESLLHPENHFGMLFDRRDQVEIFETLGVDVLLMEPFSREFSELSKEEFYFGWLFPHLKPCKIVVGYDFGFAKKKSGTKEDLVSMAKETRTQVDILPPLKVDEQVISSTLVRELLLQGQVKRAQHLLGRPYYLRGVVIYGDGRGEKLGFPTANIVPTTLFSPKEGVYATQTEIYGESFFSVTNIGKNPTFVIGPSNELRIENHILDYHGDLYGKEIRITFVDFLRDEMKFSSKEELVEQIRRDLVRARQVFR